MSRIVSILLLVAMSAAAGETTAPTETLEQRAARLLKESEKRSSIDSQASQQGAETAYQAGLKLYDDLEYEEAHKYFERALALDPTHEKAREKLRSVDALLGIHTERVGQKIRELEAADRVQREESNLVILNLIQEAQKFEEAGTVWPANADSLSRDEILATQLKNLQKAQEKYRRAKELLNYLRGTAGSHADRESVDEAIKRLSGKISDRNDDARAQKCSDR